MLGRAGRPTQRQPGIAQAVAQFQQDHLLAGQVGRLQHVLADQPVPQRQHRPQRLAEQRHHGQMVVVARGVVQQHHVQVAMGKIGQQLRPRLLAQVQLEVGIAFAHGPQHVRQQIRTQRSENPHAQGAGQRRLGLPRRLVQVADVAQDVARAFRQVAPDGGQQHPAAGTLHQQGAQLLLELGDLGRQRRLRQVQPLGRATEVQQVGNRDQALQLTQGDHGALIIYPYQFHNEERLVLSMNKP